MLLEEIEEKKTLPATSDSNQDLDKIMVFRLDKFVEEEVSFDDHWRVSALKLCAFARKFKAGEVGRAIDFRIVSIEMVDGKPKVEWEPKANRWTGVEIRAVLKGAERLDGPWAEVPEDGGSPGTARPIMRFFTVVVEVP